MSATVKRRGNYFRIYDQGFSRGGISLTTGKFYGDTFYYKQLRAAVDEYLKKAGLTPEEASHGT